MSEAEYQGAEEYAIYQAETGRLLSSGRSFAPETLLLPGQLLIKKIAPGALGDYYVENGELVKKSDQPSDHHTFDYTTKQWVDPRTLSDLQVAKWEQIKRARSSAEFGGFTWDGSPFDSDAISQSRIQGAVQLAAMAPEFTIEWTLADNSARNLSAADLANVGAALGIHVATQHAKARTLRSQIEAATTAAEVDAVTW